MGSDANRLRANWQTNGGKNAGIAENDFFQAFQMAFEGTEYKIRAKPKEFGNIYVEVELSENVLQEIYVPYGKIERHGIKPDYAIDNTRTEKTMYVEVKRQDGWVEGGKRADGRGNAHERSCKYFTPGLLKLLRKHGKLSNDVLPFWVVFQGDITRDPCRVREISFWYDEYIGHYFFWRDTQNPEKLFAHFEEYIAPLLE